MIFPREMKSKCQCLKVGLGLLGSKMQIPVCLLENDEER